jgi:hypothetical protein
VVHQVGEIAQDPSKKIMAPWTFNVKFPYDTQFTFESLMFAAGEDGNLELLTHGPPPKHPTSYYGHAPYLSASSSTSGGACSSLNPYAGPYHHAAKTTQGLLIGAHIFQPSVGTSSSSASRASPEHDSTDDYPEIEGSTCCNSTEEGHIIIMVAPVGAPSQNSSNRYPTIGRSEASNARAPSDRLAWNLNPDFNAVQLWTIMESIQHMAQEGSPLLALAQLGAEAANHVILVE